MEHPWWLLHYGLSPESLALRENVVVMENPVKICSGAHVQDGKYGDVNFLFFLGWKFEKNQSKTKDFSVFKLKLYW